LCRERPDILPKLVNLALSHGNAKGYTAMVRGVRVKYQVSNMPFTEYNKYAIQNSELGLSCDLPVYAITYRHCIEYVLGNIKLASKLNSPRSSIPQKYQIDRCVKTKDSSGTEVVVKRVN